MLKNETVRLIKLSIAIGVGVAGLLLMFEIPDVTITLSTTELSGLIFVLASCILMNHISIQQMKDEFREEHEEE